MQGYDARAPSAAAPPTLLAHAAETSAQRERGEAPGRDKLQIEEVRARTKASIKEGGTREGGRARSTDTERRVVCCRGRETRETIEQ